jgi:hypothetical protein
LAPILEKNCGEEPEECGGSELQDAEAVGVAECDILINLSDLTHCVEMLTANIKSADESHYVEQSKFSVDWISGIRHQRRFNG